MILILALVALWYAWRYSKSTIDPDWAMFNFEGFCNSWYGRDYLDCKTPLIHLWYWAIAKVVGKDVARVKFAAVDVPVVIETTNDCIVVVALEGFAM